MKKYLLTSLIASAFSLTALAQSPKDAVEKALRDPALPANAAKADALLINTKTVTDTATLAPATSPLKKDKRCKRKKKA